MVRISIAHNSRIVCKKLEVGDTITSHTAMLNGGHILAEVKEILKKETPKGNYGDGFYLFNAITFIDLTGIPPEMTPKDF